MAGLTPLVNGLGFISVWLKFLTVFRKGLLEAGLKRKALVEVGNGLIGLLDYN